MGRTRLIDGCVDSCSLHAIRTGLRQERLFTKILEAITKNISIPFRVLSVSSYMNTERSNSTLNSTPTAVADTPLPSDVHTLHAMIRELIASLKKEQHEREGVQQRLDLLLRKL